MSFHEGFFPSWSWKFTIKYKKREQMEPEEGKRTRSCEKRGIRKKNRYIILRKQREKTETKEEQDLVKMKELQRKNR